MNNSAAFAVNICRVCESKEKLINLSNNNEIIDKLVNFANISCSLEDKLPKFVCQKCKKDIEFTFEFKQKCELTDKKLRKLWQEHLRTADAKHFEFIKIEDHEKEEIKAPPDNQVDVKCNFSDDDDDDKSSNSFENDISPYDNMELKMESLGEDESEPIVDPINTTAGETLAKNDSETKNAETAPPKKVRRKNPPNVKKPAEFYKYQCYICKRPYELLKSLKKHLQTRHTNRKIECNICHRVYSCQTNLNRHAKIAHRINLYLSNETEIVPAEVPQRDQKFVCTICDKTYSCRTNLNRHNKDEHSNKALYSCDVCNKSFTRKFILEEHRFVHIEERPYACETCPFKAKSQFRLRVHVKTHDPNRPAVDKTKAKKDYKYECTCEYCGKITKGYSQHLTHVRSHTGEKPYKCDVCQKGFRSATNRTVHMTIHTDERKFECKVCGMKFRQFAHFSTHQHIHTGVRKFKCSYCDRGFTKGHAMRNHIRSMHTGETPFHCTVCPAKFTNTACLKRHVKHHE